MREGVEAVGSKPGSRVGLWSVRCAALSDDASSFHSDGWVSHRAKMHRKMRQAASSPHATCANAKSRGSAERAGDGEATSLDVD